MRVRGGSFFAAIAGGCAAARVCARFLAALFEIFARAGDCKAFVVEQALDFENRLDVFAAIEAMSAGTLHRLQAWEIRFPNSAGRTSS